MIFLKHKEKYESPLCCFDGHVSSQNAELEPKHQKITNDASSSEVTL